MAGIIMMLLLFVISLALDEKVVNLFYTSKTVIILMSYSGCIGALALWEVPMTDSSFMPRFVFIDEVSCHSSESTLLITVLILKRVIAGSKVVMVARLP